MYVQHHNTKIMNKFRPCLQNHLLLSPFNLKCEKYACDQTIALTLIDSKAIWYTNLTMVRIYKM